MALEPITRQEQIIAGKDLEPITRMERFLKDYGVSNYFGETKVNGDTLTWDGNTDGLVSIGDTLFKVSDTVLNYDDFADGGFECNSIYGVTSGNQSNLIVMQEFGVVISIGNFYSFSESAVGVDVSGGEGMIPPESGTYFTATMRSLTIPGYYGFETTVIKPLDEKYLPESVKGGGGGGGADLLDENGIIRQEYLPEGFPYGSLQKVTVMPETVLTRDPDSQLYTIPNVLELTQGRQYTVKLSMSVEGETYEYYFPTVCREAPENERGFSVWS